MLVIAENRLLEIMKHAKLINERFHDGEGIARNKGKAVFIPFTFVESRLMKIVEDKKYYSRDIEGDSNKIILSHRGKRYYYNCGGCLISIWHMNADIFKTKIVQNNFKRDRIDFEVKELIGMQT